MAKIIQQKTFPIQQKTTRMALLGLSSEERLTLWHFIYWLGTADLETSWVPMAAIMQTIKLERSGLVGITQIVKVFVNIFSFSFFLSLSYSFCLLPLLPSLLLLFLDSCIQEEQ